MQDKSVFIIRFLIFLAAFFLVDLYAWQTVKTAFLRFADPSRKLIFWFYWGITISIYLAFVSGFFYDWRKWPQILQIVFLGTAFTLFVVKLTLVIFSGVDDISRLFQYGGKWVAQGKRPEKGISRSQFIATVGIVVAMIPLLSFIKGIVFDVFNFQYLNRKIRIPNLPNAMQGLKIVQLSDIHAGSLYKHELLPAVVEKINAWKPDLILFTGDLVNDVAEEAEAIIPIFSKLRARLGVWSVTGNHDYGDYVEWKSKEEKAANFQRLMKAHERMGWNLMMNRHQIFEFGEHTLALIGIENWGGSLRFPRYGKLKQAYEGAENADVKILMSHDPSHWDLQVRPEYPNIDLTLSGHTHGLQMGIENRYFKWSPSEFMYKQWADLYKTGKQQIYVNRGFGFIGFPGRVGILPEITFIELIS